MNKSGIFLLLFLLVFMLFSCRDAKKDYWPDGKLKSVVHLRGGKYYGKAEFYQPSGDIQLVCFYKDNLLQGPLIRYYSNNKKKEQQNFDKGNLDGLSSIWYEEGGKFSETTYMNGVLNGPYREYHPGSHIKIQGQYLHGFFTGKWLYFDFSGDIIGEGEFVHGTGKQRSFYPGGKVNHEVHYKNNLREGEEIEYDKTGKVTSIKVFSHDSLTRSIR